MQEKQIEQAYVLAVEQYTELGVGVDAALKRLAPIAISVHCWQGDDVGGFEGYGGEVGGGGRHGQLSWQSAND